LLTVLAKLQKTEKPSPEKSCGVGVLFWRVMRHAKKTKSKPPKKIAKPKKAAALSKAQSPFKTGKIGNKECVLGIDPRRVVAILGGLDEAYPNATCELKHKNAFQLLISTILSAQTTDVRVNQVTETLYKKYPNPEAFAYATPHELEQELRPTGFFRNKTKSVMGASKAIVEEFGGQVPRTMEEILTLPGVARKTANVVLGTAYGIAAGVVVDTHVFASTHLARPSRLRGQKTSLRRLQPRKNLLLRRQNHVHPSRLALPAAILPAPRHPCRYRALIHFRSNAAVI
jgi:endonuclease-3